MEEFTLLVHSASDFLWNNLLLFLLCGTGILLYHPAGICADLQVRARAAGHVRGIQPPRQGGRQGRHELLPGADHRRGRPGGHRQHRRLRAPPWPCGGPGAIFWMWVSAFFGMATIYAEAILAQNFKTTDGRSGHRRPRLLHPRRLPGRVRQVPGRVLLRGHRAGPGLYGQHGPVQLHQRCLPRRPSASPSWPWVWSSPSLRPSSSWAASSALPPSPKSWSPSWPCFTLWAA